MFYNEIEDQNSFSFLDKKISETLRKKLLKHKFIEKVHSVVHFTNFMSFFPMTYKSKLLETMLFCYFSICSSYEKFHKEIVKLQETFKQNSYQEKFIDVLKIFK